MPCAVVSYGYAEADVVLATYDTLTTRDCDAVFCDDDDDTKAEGELWHHRPRREPRDHHRIMERDGNRRDERGSGGHRADSRGAAPSVGTPPPPPERVSPLHLVRWTRVVFDDAHLLVAPGARADERVAAARALRLAPCGRGGGVAAAGGVRWALLERSRSARLWRGRAPPVRALADVLGLSRDASLAVLRASVHDIDEHLERVGPRAVTNVAAAPLCDVHGDETSSASDSDGAAAKAKAKGGVRRGKSTNNRAPQCRRSPVCRANVREAERRGRSSSRDSATSGGGIFSP